MVFNFIDFLLGAKKAKKPQKNVQAASPLNNTSNAGSNNQNQNTNNSGNAGQQNSQPDQAAQSTNQENNTQDQIQFEDSTDKNKQENVPAQNKVVGVDNNQAQNTQQENPLQKSKVSEALAKLHDEAKSSNEKVSGMISEIRDMKSSVNAIGTRVDDLEEARKTTDEKLSDIDNSMTKFLSLYELVNNQFNPFVENNAPITQTPKKIVLDQDGNSIGEGSEENNSEGAQSNEQSTNSENPSKTFENLIEKSQDLGKAPNHISALGKNDMHSAILALDTLDIEQAAGEAVPLTQLKNNTNSLVTILSWLEYLVKKVGIEETRNTLRYYTEVLRWITPEVFFDLDKYLKGMRDKDLEEGQSLGVKDHIVSLYFISKLNEKALDEKLTNAVIQIIKQ